MKLTSLLELADKLERAGKIDNFCDFFGCIGRQYVAVLSHYLSDGIREVVACHEALHHKQ